MRVEKVDGKILFMCLGHNLRDGALDDTKYSRLFQRN